MPGIFPQLSSAIPACLSSPRQLQYSGQLEDSEDLHQALERVVLLLFVPPVLQTTGGGRVGEPAGRGLGSFNLSRLLLVHEELDKEWKDTQYIHNIHPIPQEGTLCWSSQQSKYIDDFKIELLQSKLAKLVPDYELKCEPSNTNSFNYL